MTKRRSSHRKPSCLIRLLEPGLGLAILGLLVAHDSPFIVLSAFLFGVFVLLRYH